MPTTDYLINGKKVPSVTTVLSCINFISTDILISWGIKLYKQGIDYKVYRKNAANVGSAIHEAIENYPNPPKESFEWSEKEWFRILSSFKNHSKWIEKFNARVILQEEHLLSPTLLTGGTPDLVVEAKNKILLLDHKSSKTVDVKGVAQIGAYAFMLDELKNIKVDGAIIMHHDHDGNLTPYPLTQSILKDGLELFKHAHVVYDIIPKLKKAVPNKYNIKGL